MNTVRAWGLLLVACLGVPRAAHADETVYDVVIYGGSSSAVVAAVQVSRMGRTVAIVCPDTRLGGLSASGLGWTDSGDKAVIGGLAREFYRHVKSHYDRAESWTWQPKEKCRHYRPDADAMWVFEPHVAEAIFERMVHDAGVPTFRDHWLDRSESGVEKENARIVAITTTNGRTFRGRVFIDATYEGDLLAAAGVSYTVGRESRDRYGESLAGVQKANARSHQFAGKIDPYVIPGDPSSGLLPRIHDGEPGADGDGDHRVQAYNYRVCLTRVPENRVPFPRPEGYDASQYELLLRTLQAGSTHVFGKFDPMPNAKTDTNNHGSFSTDNIGFNYDYPEASYARRREILAEHEQYQKGYFYFLANDPRVPEPVRTRMAAWGLAKDEFTGNGHWPHQIYVREARRMVSDFVQTELHLRGKRPTPRSVGMGSYNMDSHNVQRYVARDADSRAYVLNEGDIQVNPGGAYAIAYDALVPKRSECTNLLVPVCLSSSHIAYGSVRMEPVFMILGQSAATAAVMAIEAGRPVQDVDYPELSSRLREDGQVLAKTVPMRVMAYNIKHGRGMDGRVDLERAARVIEAVKPDVVTLQEIDVGCGRSGGVDQAVWLGERLGMTPIFGPFMDYDGGQYGMAMLSRWPIVAWENHELPPGPEPRTVLAARLRVARGVEVVVAGIHIYGSAGQRLAQAREVIRLLETETRPVILAGDFNSRPGSPVMALFADPWANPDKGADRLTFDSVTPSMEIDYILLRPAGHFDRTAIDVLDEPLASDHRPLVVETLLIDR